MPADSPLCMPLETPDEMSSCSCSNSEENSRKQQQQRGVRLFGVDILSSSEAPMRKSVSMNNLSHYAGASSCNNLAIHENLDAADGYVSDGLVQTNSNARARRKGVPWTEDEHRLFLLGLQKLGKGDWRGISKTFVTTRTPTQVASHAQKYFIRQSNLSKRKRRSSLFDMSPAQEAELTHGTKNVNLQTSFLELGLGHDRVSVPAAPLEKIMEERVFFPSQDGRGMISEQEQEQEQESLPNPPRNPAMPSLWLDLNHQQQQQQQQIVHRVGNPLPRPRVVKPVASFSTGPVRIDDREMAPAASSTSSQEPGSVLSLKLEQPVRHSAFHVRASGAAGAAGLVESPIRCT